ncbi:VWA domain-containing protein [Halomonas vilamensis]|uniref:VWA domain-containing protein n=1 Tax=Vreelandella vilamensis TaxID=531309 RepID=A0ABU1H993_9GAMM|nr:VWA domain-containing protein [Halomonas vilamensis]MDR5900287.1 VWA domain-containing protein [Halomonas vilamensis]
MQRILRDEGYVLVDPRQPERLQGLIHRYCPPSIGNLFAIPREGRTGDLEWWTELPGQPRRLDELPAAEQAALQERLSQRLSALKSLIDELERRGDPAAAELQALPTAPALDTLYSVGGEPLLIRWAPIAPAPAASPTPTVAPTATPKVPTPIPPPIPKQVSTRRRVGWVLPLLLSGLALLGLWMGITHWERFPWPPTEEVIEEPFACRSADTPPPEFITIFDTSGSMNLHISTTEEDEQWYATMPEPLRTMRAHSPRMQRITASPSRMEVAKEAFSELARAIDPAVDIGLVTYRGCEAPIVQGRFSAEQRPMLVQGVRNLVADDGTPLAASLQKAASMVDGRERDAVILAFVDGADGCGNDHCAVAREIAMQQPRLRINVVDISNRGLSNCIAEQTGGRVFGSQDAAAISVMLKDAGREALSAAQCSG